MEKQCSEREAESLYDDFLNESYGEFVIGCCHFEASKILQKLDPVVYQQGLFDFLDMENLEIK